MHGGRGGEETDGPRPGAARPPGLRSRAGFARGSAVVTPVTRLTTERKLIHLFSSGQKACVEEPAPLTVSLRPRSALPPVNICFFISW